jgi:hypothetical protein
MELEANIKLFRKHLPSIIHGAWGDAKLSL